MDECIEEWRVLRENLYEASSYGRIRSLSNRARVLKLFTLADGYHSVNLRNAEGVYKTERVARLIGSVFLENPENKPEINHKNFVRNDDRVLNLEWCTKEENIKHSKLERLFAKGADNHMALLNDAKVIEIRDQLNCGVMAAEVARYFGVDRGTISLIKRGITWKHLL